MNKKNILGILFFWVTSIIIVYQFSKGSTELFYNLLFVIVVIVVSSTTAGYILLEIKFSLRPASEDELKTEDSVLLRGISFLQSTAFIYLNLISTEGDFAFLLKITIPIFAALFFAFRGYGAIKKSGTHRVLSNLILIAYLPNELLFYVALASGISNLYVYFLIIGFLVVLSATFEKVLEIMSPRYGIVYLGKGKRAQLEEMAKSKM